MPARIPARLLGLLAVLAAGPASVAQAPRSAEDLLVVDCLLPGQVRQLGQRSVYVSARQPARTTAVECRIRGGEYVAQDRASLRTALEVWLPAATAGDVEAMTVVGEMFEKGLGVPADHAAAAQWYRRAADRDAVRAQINLGHLYERGLGVPRDAAEALRWYRRASGLPEAIELDAEERSASAQAATEAAAQAAAQVEALQREVGALQQQVGGLQQSLATQSAQLGAARDALVAAQADVAAARAEQASLRQRAEAASGAAAQELSRAVATGAARLQGLEAALAQREQDVAARQSETTNLRAELARAQASGTQQAARIAELERQVAAAETAQRATPAPVAAAPVASAAPLAPPVAVAGPELAIIEPEVMATRGVTVVAAADRSDAAARRVVGRVTAPAGLLHLAVNGAPATPNELGVFTADVPVMAGDTPVAIVAVDRQGKRSTVEFTLRGRQPAAMPAVAAPATPTAPAAPPWASIDFGRYHALVIGNNEYRHLTDLKSAAGDAREVAGLLRDRYGFEVTLIVDADRYGILAALNTLREKLTSRDNLLIYYAGHGELDEVNNRGHWLPVDAEPGSTANWIPSTAITDVLNIMQARQVMLVVDSCYAGALTRSSVSRLVTGASESERLHWLRTVSQKRSRTVLTSGGVAPVLDAGGGGHSVFARALLEVLQANADVLDGQRLHREVAARVSYAADNVGFDQVPEYAPVRFAGHEAGEFFFVPRRP